MKTHKQTHAARAEEEETRQKLTLKCCKSVVVPYVCSQSQQRVGLVPVEQPCSVAAPLHVECMWDFTSMLCSHHWRLLNLPRFFITGLVTWLHGSKVLSLWTSAGVFDVQLLALFWFLCVVSLHLWVQMPGSVVIRIRSLFVVRRNKSENALNIMLTMKTWVFLLFQSKRIQLLTLW